MTMPDRAPYEDVSAPVLSMAWVVTHALLDAADPLGLKSRLAAELTALHAGIVAEMERRAQASRRSDSLRGRFAG
jgi:hypothetical protein